MLDITSVLEAFERLTRVFEGNTEKNEFPSLYKKHSTAIEEFKKKFKDEKDGRVKGILFDLKHLLDIKKSDKEPYSEKQKDFFFLRVQEFMVLLIGHGWGISKIMQFCETSPMDASALLRRLLREDAEEKNRLDRLQAEKDALAAAEYKRIWGEILKKMREFHAFIDSLNTNWDEYYNLLSKINKLQSKVSENTIRGNSLSEEIKLLGNLKVKRLVAQKKVTLDLKNALKIAQQELSQAETEFTHISQSHPDVPTRIQQSKQTLHTLQDLEFQLTTARTQGNTAETTRLGAVVESTLGRDASLPVEIVNVNRQLQEQEQILAQIQAAFTKKSAAKSKVDDCKEKLEKSEEKEVTTAAHFDELISTKTAERDELARDNAALISEISRIKPKVDELRIQAIEREQAAKARANETRTLENELGWEDDQRVSDGMDRRLAATEQMKKKRELDLLLQERDRLDKQIAEADDGLNQLKQKLLEFEQAGREDLCEAQSISIATQENDLLAFKALRQANKDKIAEHQQTDIASAFVNADDRYREQFQTFRPGDSNFTPSSPGRNNTSPQRQPPAQPGPHPTNEDWDRSPPEEDGPPRYSRH
jgi:chromosome segregation ATPase